MLSNSPIGLNDCPTLNPVYVFRWEESQQAHMLLYPEGLIKLNGSAGLIMAMVDGKRTVEEIVEELKSKFDNNPTIVNDVYAFMEVAMGKGWISLKSAA